MKLHTTDGWIGVDLDGTLAHHGTGEWKGFSEIGEPIAPMVDRVKQWLKEGRRVKIMTARAASIHCQADFAEVVHPIYAWCEKHIGVGLEVTCRKDMHMIQLWDDRAIQVVFNTGIRADGQP